MNMALNALAAQGVTARHITADSRKVTAGSLFLAYPGEQADGRNFISQAISQGAVAVLWRICQRWRVDTGVVA